MIDALTHHGRYDILPQIPIDGAIIHRFGKETGPPVMPFPEIEFFRRVSPEGIVFDAELPELNIDVAQMPADEKRETAAALKQAAERLSKTSDST